MIELTEKQHLHATGARVGPAVYVAIDGDTYFVTGDVNTLDNPYADDPYPDDPYPDDAYPDDPYVDP